MNTLFLLPVVSDSRDNKPTGALNNLGTKSAILASCVLGY